MQNSKLNIWQNYYINFLGLTVLWETFNYRGFKISLSPVKKKRENYPCFQYQWMWNTLNLKHIPEPNAFMHILL